MPTRFVERSCGNEAAMCGPISIVNSGCRLRVDGQSEAEDGVIPVRFFFAEISVSSDCPKRFALLLLLDSLTRLFDISEIREILTRAFTRARRLYIGSKI